jgi:hypothetical protein
VKALEIHAGPRARQWLRERGGGLQAQDVPVIPEAAGGPKGLVLNPLDRYLFGEWLAGAPQTLHLVGASIGVWRMACACLPDAQAPLAEMAEDYNLTQHYDHAPGRASTVQTVSTAFGRKLDERLAPRAAEVLGHPTRRLHVVASRGRHLLSREGPWRTPIGYAGAFLANAWRRRALGAWIERVVFSDLREALPLPLDDLRTRRATLREVNLAPAVLASCSIPFWLRAVSGIPRAPPGAYWDDGITDHPACTCAIARCRRASCSIRVSSRRWCPAGCTRPGAPDTGPPPRSTTSCCCRQARSGSPAGPGGRLRPSVLLRLGLAVMRGARACRLTSTVRPQPSTSCGSCRPYQSWMPCNRPHQPRPWPPVNSTPSIPF